MDNYDPDPGQVKKLRQHKKRGDRKEEDHHQNVKKAKVDVTNVDYSLYSSGIKANVKIFDPNNKKSFGKAKQKRFKKNKNGGGGRSLTYK